MPMMSVGAPLRLGPRSAAAHRAAAAPRSVGGSKTPDSASASSTSRGWGTIGPSGMRREAGNGGKGAAAALGAREHRGARDERGGGRAERRRRAGGENGFGAGAPFFASGSNGSPARLGMGGAVGTGCCTEISISPDADGAGARMPGGGSRRRRIEAVRKARLGVLGEARRQGDGHDGGSRRRRRRKRDRRHRARSGGAGRGYRRNRPRAGGLLVSVGLGARRLERADVNGGRAVAHRVERRAHRVGGGVRYLRGDGARPRLRLHRAEHARALEPELRVRVAGAQLNGPLDHLLGTLRVAPSQEHLAQPAVNVAVARGQLARRHERRLRLAEAVRVEVHPRDRHEHRHVARVSLRRVLTHLLDERGPRRTAQRVAERDGDRRARVLLPALGELVDRVGHSGMRIAPPHCPTKPRRREPKVGLS